MTVSGFKVVDGLRPSKTKNYLCRINSLFKCMSTYCLYTFSFLIDTNAFIQVLKFAYELGKAHKCKQTEPWGWLVSWFSEKAPKSFPETATRLARATTFNKTNQVFHQSCRGDKKTPFHCQGYLECGWDGGYHGPESRRGQQKSGECWTLVTCAVNALGNATLHILCSPGNTSTLISSGMSPLASLETENKSGWMQEEDFLKIIQKPLQHKRSCWSLTIITATCPCNKLTFVGDLALFSSPTPNTVPCSHWTAVCLALSRRWFTPSVTAGWDIQYHHPGNLMSIYDIPAIVRDSFTMAAAPSNVQSVSRFVLHLFKNVMNIIATLSHHVILLIYLPCTISSKLCQRLISWLMYLSKIYFKYTQFK